MYGVRGKIHSKDTGGIGCPVIKFEYLNLLSDNKYERQETARYLKVTLKMYVLKGTHP
jgi:hypothetical protein